MAKFGTIFYPDPHSLSRDYVISMVRGLTLKIPTTGIILGFAPVLLRTLPMGLCNKQTTFATSGDMTMVNIKGHLPQIEVLSNNVLRPRLNA